MADREHVQELSLFLLDYATSLLGAGVHTSRAVRNISRIAEAYGYRADISLSQKNIMMSISSQEDATVRRTTVRKLKPLHFNFVQIQDLSALTWRAWDDRVPLGVLVEEYHRMMAKPRYPMWLVMVCASAANASFCRLFGGVWTAMGVVFVATFAGFFIRQMLAKRHLNHLAIFVIAAFVASMIASVATCHHWGGTPEVALASSVLFLVPGVQLINAVMDLLDGHILNGVQRGIQAGMLIICIALGLTLTMLIVGIQWMS